MAKESMWLPSSSSALPSPPPLRRARFTQFDLSINRPSFIKVRRDASSAICSTGLDDRLSFDEDKVFVEQIGPSIRRSHGNEKLFCE